ncbi:MAG: DUF2514 family protein [Pseudomonadota bacterium]
MIGLPDLKTPLLWVLGLGRAAALATAGIERTRGASARTDAAQARQDLAEYRATAEKSAADAERAQCTQEQTWRTRVDGVITDGQQQVAAARADVDRAADTERRVRQQLDTFRAAIRAASATPTVATGGPSAADPLDLLADLFGRADTRAGDLARIADERGAAGTTCERHSDATEP